MNQIEVPVLLAAFVPIVALAVAISFERRRRRAVEKPPQKERLLHPAGYSLGVRLDEIQDAILNRILAACVLCVVAACFALIAAACIGSRAAVACTALAAVAFASFAMAGAWVALRCFRLVSEAWNIRLGLRGEQAVAEALHETADCGFRVFHDLPGGDDWNIDHVAAGPRGVFLIETKARRRRKSRNGQPEHVVVYDGKALHFPAGCDLEAIPQAQRNARWLAELLQKKTAESVTVEPLVVVPGWYVEPQGNFPVKVMNETYLTGFLRGQRERIPAKQVQRIVAALDEKCRDVAF